MMKIPEEYITILERFGHPLEHDLGVKETALSRGHALEAIRILRLCEIPVVGGDVVRLTAGKAQYVGDNWYVKRLPGEGPKDYITRSHDKAEAYLRNYQDPDDGTIMYVIVPSDKGLLNEVGDTANN